jgi:hypothetical protein
MSACNREHVLAPVSPSSFNQFSLEESHVS